MAAFRLSVTALPPLQHVPAMWLKAVHFCDFGSVRESVLSSRRMLWDLGLRTAVGVFSKFHLWCV